MKPIFNTVQDGKGWAVIAETVEGRCTVLRGPEEIMCDVVSSRLNDAVADSCQEVGYLLEATKC